MAAGSGASKVSDFANQPGKRLFSRVSSKAVERPWENPKLVDEIRMNSKLKVLPALIASENILIPS